MERGNGYEKDNGENWLTDEKVGNGYKQKNSVKWVNVIGKQRDGSKQENRVKRVNKIGKQSWKKTGKGEQKTHLDGQEEENGEDREEMREKRKTGKQKITI